MSDPRGPGADANQIAKPGGKAGLALVSRYPIEASWNPPDGAIQAAGSILGKLLSGDVAVLREGKNEAEVAATIYTENKGRQNS